jgi:hypothetical protein
MTGRASSPVLRRSSLPLTAQDEADLALIRSSEELRAAFAGLLAGSDARALLHDSPSEAALLHAVFALGLARIREEVDAAGYAELAASYSPAIDLQRRSAARRRRPAWAAEA